MLPERDPTAPREDPELEQVLARIRDALRGMRYGEVRLSVQDGVVVQIERTEKLRLSRR
jgi:hypothetical protein